MKITHMRAFTELMATRSVSQAARNLNRSQPSVSALIASLEQEIGMPLFQRRKGRLIPVPESHYLYEECHELLARIGTVSQNMRRLRTLVSGQLNIAVMPGPSVFYMPAVIADLCADHPDIQTSLVSRSSDAIYQLMSTQQYDLGLADYDAAQLEESGLVDHEVFRLRCVCALSKDDALAAQESVSIADIASRAIACLYEDHPTHARLMEQFELAGYRPNVRFTAQNFVSLLTYVKRSLAVAIVDPTTAIGHQRYFVGNDSVVFRPLREEVLTDLVLIRPSHRPASRIAEHFTHRIRESLLSLQS